MSTNKPCQINFSIQENNANFSIEDKNLTFSLDSQYQGGGEGTKDYEKLINKPQINDVTLIGNKSFEELGVNTMTNLEIKNIFNKVFKGE